MPNNTIQACTLSTKYVIRVCIGLPLNVIRDYIILIVAPAESDIKEGEQRRKASDFGLIQIKNNKIKLKGNVKPAL